MKFNLKTGLYFALATAIISGVSNFLNKKAIAVVGDSFIFTTAKNILVAIALCAILLFFAKFKELKKINRKQWLLLIVIGIVGGSLPFVLFFKGLTLTSAIQASFIHKSIFIWATLLAIPLLKEKITKLQIMALLILLAGNFILDGFTGWQFGWGSLLILLATLLWSCEYIIAKFVLHDISSWIVAWSRMFFGAIVLLIWLGLSDKVSVVASLGSLQWAWISMGAILLLGYVGFWYTALKRQPVSVVASILVLASPITTLITVFNTGHFSFRQLVGVITISLATIYIMSLSKNNVVILGFNPRISARPSGRSRG